MSLLWRILPIGSPCLHRLRSKAVQSLVLQSGYSADVLAALVVIDFRCEM